MANKIRYRANTLFFSRKLKGVSDIIANILILAITVALFSGVIIWVWALPPPPSAIYAEMDIEAVPPHTTGFYLNITHKGGATLECWRTRILVLVMDGAQQVQYGFPVSNDPDVDSDKRWVAGEIWNNKTDTAPPPAGRLNHRVTLSTRITLIIYDIKNAVEIWKGTVPVRSGIPPILYSKGTEPSPVVKGAKFTIFASLIDTDRVVDTSRFQIDLTKDSHGNTALKLGWQKFRYDFFRDRYYVEINAQQSQNMFTPGLSKTKPFDRYYKVYAYIIENGVWVNKSFDTIRINVTEGELGVVDLRIDYGQTATPGFWNSRDIFFSNDKPLTNERITITARIHNDGGGLAKSADVTFRVFKPNNVIEKIDTVRITNVSGWGEVTAVTNWKPEVSGTHLIWVNISNVKPADNRLDNNDGNRTIRVYVYFDDLESGIGKWRHEATIYRVTGEGPVEYEATFKDIDLNGDGQTGDDCKWDPAKSDLAPNKWYNTTADYHSYPFSYYMNEPKIEPRPIDALLSFDCSCSMAWNDPNNLRIAAGKRFVDRLNLVKDQTAVYSFGKSRNQYGAGPYGPSDPYYGVGTDGTSTYRFELKLSHDKTAITTAIDSCAVSSWNTPMYQAAWKTSQYMMDTHVPNKVRAQLLLCDGEPNVYNQADKTNAENKVRDASRPPYDVYFFAIGLNIQGTNAEQVMRDLASKAGARGKYYNARTAADLDRVYQDIADILITASNEQKGISPRAELLSSSGATPEPKTTTNAPCVADTEIRSGSPTRNFGTNSVIYIGYYPGSSRYRIERGLFRFDLSSIPAGSTINTATLRIYKPGSGDAGTGSCTINVHRITASWTETGATWNNMNANYDSTVVASTVVTYGASGWISWDIRSLVVNWLSGTPNYGVMLKGAIETGSANLDRAFWSRQTSNQPYIYIDYTSGSNQPPNTPTITGPTSGNVGTTYSYTVTGTDPDNNDIKYTVDWGDGTTSTTPFVSSGTAQTLTHSWSGTGTYQVRAKATDTNNADSAWSLPLSVAIGTGGGGGGGTPGTPGHKNLTTYPFRLPKSSQPGKIGTERAILTFYTKYNLLAGVNGGVVGIVTENDNKFRYITPVSPYSGSISPNYTYRDSFGREIRYAFNGLSSQGKFTWEYVYVDISDFIEGRKYNPMGSALRVRFWYVYCFGGENGGWWIDDVEVKVIRNETSPISESRDKWEYYRGSVGGGTTHSGTYSWRHPFDASGDNALITTLDLTNVKNATLVAYMRFNINPALGLPPHGVRLEVSKDNGASWEHLTKGVRVGYGVSGSAPDTGPAGGNLDDIAGDGKSFTGIPDPGANPYWVKTTTLTRLENCDISKWCGFVLLLKFRVIISVKSPIYATDLGIIGNALYIDDVAVIGVTAGSSTLSRQNEQSFSAASTEADSSVRAGETQNKKILSPATDWEMFRANPARTGVSNSVIADTLNVMWRAQVNSPISSSPAISGGKVYVGTNDGMMYCFRETDGATLWPPFRTGGGIMSSPAVSGGRVFFGSMNRKIYALDANTGTEIWNYTTGGEIVSSPVVSGGYVYVGSLDNHLYAFTTDGTFKWKYPTLGPVQSSPAISGGRVYFGSWDMNVYAVDAVSGQKIWNRTVNGSIRSAIAVDGGRVFVTAEDGNITCFDTAQNWLWSFPANGAIRSSPAVKGDYVYFGDNANHIYCLAVADGRLIWENSTDGYFQSSPALSANDRVLIGCGNGRLYSFSAVDGTLLWNQPIGTSIISSPAIANEKVFVGSDNGYLYVFGTGPPALFLNVQPESDTVISGRSLRINVYVTDSRTGSFVTGASLSFTASAGGTFTITTDNGDGWYSTVYTAPSVTGATRCLITATASKTGYTTSSQSAALTITPLSTMRVRLEANPSVLPATSSTEITAAIEDSYGNPVYGAVVNFSSNLGGSFNPPNGTTQSTGLVSTVFKPPAVSQYTQVTISASVFHPNFALSSGHTNINVMPALFVNLSASPSSLVANRGTATLTVVVSNGLGPVSNALITLFSGLGTISPSTGMTDANGRFSSIYTPPSIVNTRTVVEVWANATKQDFVNGTGSVRLTVYPPETNLLFVKLTAERQTLNLGASTTLTVFVANATDAPLAGANVGLSSDGIGTLEPINGYTDAYGNFSSRFTAPMRAGHVTIRATATLQGWITGTGEITIFVLPTPNAPPRCNITMPVDGMRVSGNIMIVGTASDPDGDQQIIKVQVSIDDAWIDATGTTSWSYNWNTTNVANGWHTIGARAYDGMNYSPIVKVLVNVSNVPPNHPPICEILSPPDGAQLSGTVIISGTATDQDGDILSVQLKLGTGEWINLTVTAGGWNYSWDTTTVSNGDYTVYVKATDGKAESKLRRITVTVNNPAPKKEWWALPGFETPGIATALTTALALFIFMFRRRRKKL